MSAIMRVYTRVVVEEDGAVVTDFGSINSPVKEVTIDGTFTRQGNITLAPGETVTIYDYDESDTLALAVVIVRDAGFVDVAVQHDAPTSTTDTTPLGTSRTWQHTPLSCDAPWILSSVDGLTNADPADHAEQNGTTAGFFEDAQETRGRVYEIQIKNPDDADDDVTFDYLVVA